MMNFPCSFSHTFRRALRWSLFSVCWIPLAVMAQSVTAVAGETPDTEKAKKLLEQAEARPAQPWMVPSESDMPSGEVGDLIHYGHDLLLHTSKLIGPLAPDASKRYAGNNLNCIHCHEVGPSGLPAAKPYAVPHVNVIHEYPKLDVKSMKVISLEERIAGMVGKGPVQIKDESREMQAMIAYIQWLGSGVSPGKKIEGTGLKETPMPNRAADPKEGKELYKANCAPCHGLTGEGVKRIGYKKGDGYAYPPIAGNDSYDDGGHMNMIPLLTRFVHANMPFGSRAEKPMLKLEEAYDISAYVVEDLKRKHNPGRANAYPNPVFRAEGFAYPEMFPNDPKAYQRARFGPFSSAQPSGKEAAKK